MLIWILSRTLFFWDYLVQQIDLLHENFFLLSSDFFDMFLNVRYQIFIWRCDWLWHVDDFFQLLDISLICLGLIFESFKFVQLLLKLLNFELKILLQKFWFQIVFFLRRSSCFNSFELRRFRVNDVLNFFYFYLFFLFSFIRID